VALNRFALRSAGLCGVLAVSSLMIIPAVGSAGAASATKSPVVVMTIESKTQGGVSVAGGLNPGAGVQAAALAINKAGGIQGRPVKVIA
jgi:hypothetical protein